MSEDNPTREFMSQIAEALDKLLVEHHGKRKGFVIAVFDFTENEEEGFADFVSNCDRESSVPALEQLAKVLKEKSYIPPTIGNA